MHEIDLAQADLNLLVVLDVLLQEQNVTRAAKRLHRTQSSTSHALSRLRELLDDPILVRVGGQMHPTPKAEQLAVELPRILRLLQQMLGKRDAFDPSTSTRIFTLAAPDFVASVLPGLLERFHRAMPEGSVELISPSRSMYRDLIDDRFDLVVAPPQKEQEDLQFEALDAMEWVVFARRTHPAVKSWSIEAWARYPHIRVRTSSGIGPVDEAADLQNITRQIGAYLPHFWLAPPLLASTDMLLTVPKAVLVDAAPRFDLVALRPPIALAPIAMQLYWNATRDRDPAIEWFRTLVKNAFGRMSQAAMELPVMGSP